MKSVESIRSFDSIKLLADHRRMEILQQLMAYPATLTHLARAMGKSQAWVRHHIVVLESAGLVEVSEIRRTGKVTEIFYRAKADALLLQEIILPRLKQSAVIFLGSHDMALERAVVTLAKHVTLLSLPVGSLDGLVYLRQGLCQVSGAHLLDKTGEYNTPFIRHLFPDRDVEIVTLAHRTQGLMLASKNPKGIKKVADVAGPNIRFVNRNPGSGTRHWLDNKLKQLKLPTEKINGYDRIVNTHSDAAALIETGAADAAIGLQAAAHQHGLGFIPLFEERYDLVHARENKKILTPLLDYLSTASFRTTVSKLTGYNTTHSGERIPL